MSADLTPREARRVFLHAQSLSRARPRRKPRAQDASAYLERQGIVQLDTVNVLARAHYLPLYSRLGPYDTAEADHEWWGHADGHAAEAFEHWGHEASVMPHDLLPAMHHRMRSRSTWKARTRDQLERETPGLIAAVLAAVEAEGPVVAADLAHLGPEGKRRGSWWDHNHVKVALEYLFITGEVAASRARHFARTYDSTERAWGLPRASVGDWGLSRADAHQQLFDRALGACGVGTVKDLTDHFRLPYAARPAGDGKDANAGGQAWAESAVERGLAGWVSVDGWDAPALMAHDAQDPGVARASTLLSPFDPVCWFRPRLQRMFGVDYRIEIYTPAAKRVFGYYCLPLLVGDQIVARLDLKADRKTRTLLVQAAWHEPGKAPGARRLSPATVAQAASKELATMARWLELDTVTVVGRGDLAPQLASETGDSHGS